MTREDELKAIQLFEQTKGVTHLDPVDDVDRIFEREREGREKRSKARMNREPQRLHSWVNGQTRAKRQKEAEMVSRNGIEPLTPAV